MRTDVFGEGRASRMSRCQALLLTGDIFLTRLNLSLVYDLISFGAALMLSVLRTR
jgi:hypothetical protein